MLQDLLHHHVAVGIERPQPAQVAHGVTEPVDVVDAHAAHLVAPQEVGDQPVAVVEDDVVLDAQPGKARDGEEAAVVELLAGGAPVGQPIALAAEERVEGVGVAGHRLELGVEGASDLEIALGEHVEGLLEGVLGALALDERLVLGGGRGRQRSEGTGDAGELLGLAALGGAGEELLDAGRRDRQLLAVVVDHDAAAPAAQHQLTRLDHASVVVAEHGHEHRRRGVRVSAAPGDVEVAGVGARGAVFEHLPPPAVGGAGEGHVVGDRVEHDAQPLLGERRGHPLEPLGAAEVVAEPAVVDDVVAMGAARGGLQHRRAVDVADPERRQVAGAGRHIVEGEAGVQLHPVRRRGPRPASTGDVRSDGAVLLGHQRWHLRPPRTRTRCGSAQPCARSAAAAVTPRPRLPRGARRRPRGAAPRPRRRRGAAAARRGPAGCGGPPPGRAGAPAGGGAAR